jgi:SAM-dependent methyltransferase
LDDRVTIVSTLNRLNREHPWSHNDAYARFVLRQGARTLRDGGTVALDIGCGTGNLLRRLAERFPRVVGVEADAATAERAAALVRTLLSASVVNARFPLDDGRTYDFVSAVAVLHHLPLHEGIRAVHEVVAPGGRLAIVGVYREERSDAPFSLASLLLNPLIGLIRHPRRVDALPDNMNAPAVPASDSYREIRDALRAALPGVRVRRGLFWRYTATWRAPQGRAD